MLKTSSMLRQKIRRFLTASSQCTVFQQTDPRLIWQCYIAFVTVASLQKGMFPNLSMYRTEPFNGRGFQHMCLSVATNLFKERSRNHA